MAPARPAHRHVRTLSCVKVAARVWKVTNAAVYRLLDRRAPGRCHALAGECCRYDARLVWSIRRSGGGAADGEELACVVFEGELRRADPPLAIR